MIQTEKEAFNLTVFLTFMCNKIFVKKNYIFTWPALIETVDNLSHSFIGLWEDEITTSVYIIPDTMGQLWTPSLVSRTSPRRSELVVVHPSAEMFPEPYGK